MQHFLRVCIGSGMPVVKQRAHQRLGKVELRRKAAQALAAVDAERGQSLEDALDSVAKNMLWEDRAWIMEVASTELRYRGRIDYLIGVYSRKKAPTGSVLRLLRIALAQMLAQDHPPELIASETVSAIRAKEGTQAAGFANALLRQVVEALPQWRAWEYPATESAAIRAAWCSLPSWMYGMFVKWKGEEWTRDLGAAALARPKIGVKVWKGAFEEHERLPDLNAPLGYVQDSSNFELCAWVGDRLSPKSGPILDLCAAPGGKTLGLVEQGRSVVATDKSESRLSRVRENVTRLGAGDFVEIRNFSEVWQEDRKWGAIWLDAPCTSSGLLRRHPEVKWNRKYEDVEIAARKQAELVAWAGEHLAPKGQLIYSVCSLFEAEHLKDAPESKFWAPGIGSSGDGLFVGIR